MAPVLVLCTLTVFASGVALLLLGPSSRGSLMLVHKASFIVWLAVTALHVLGHLPEIGRGLVEARGLRSDVFAVAGNGSPARIGRGGRSSRLSMAGYALAARRPGSAGRALALAGGLAIGLILALALIPHFGPWLNYHSSDH